MINILLTVSYDGVSYCGWQNQKNGVSVQQKLEEALGALFKTQIAVQGASRTDAGVHAIGQRALFQISTNIPVNKIPYALNAYLPSDIVVTNAEVVNSNFHPIYSAKRKTYEYGLYIDTFMNPLLLNRFYHIKHNLDLESMEKACKHFIGQHDFKAFCASGATSKTTVREIYSLELVKNGKIVLLRICGNGFLYNMVRIIAGTLIYVGEGKISHCNIPGIILSKNRSFAGKTAPPYGLSLINIEYGG